MRLVERNIHREPSMGEVFEHGIIGGVHVGDDVTVTSLSDVGIDHPPSRRVRVRPQKMRTPTRRAARPPQRGGGSAH